VIDNELSLYRDVISKKKIDGSSPQEAVEDTAKYLTPVYMEIARKIERQKVRARKKRGHTTIPEGENDETDIDVGEEEDNDVNK
jgi:hypothetical protein